MPILQRDEMANNLLEQAVVLLDAGVVQRNIHHWDFTIVVTEADLVSYYKSDAIAVVSRSLEGAVISTCRIDPRAIDQSIAEEDRIKRLAARIQTLAVHALGHYCGLGHVESSENIMHDFQTVQDLDEASELTDEQLEMVRKDLRMVADQRLEEAGGSQRHNSIVFYLRAAWINRSNIVEALREAKPWQFPYRLSRLTTAAVSAMMILLITAEAWDLGMSQPPGFISIFALLAILLTTVYVLVRQRLFVRRERRRLSEQNVVTNVSTFAIVLVGMSTTFGLLFLSSIGIAQLFFTHKLVGEWTTSIEGPISAHHYFSLAVFVASLGILIGALGATFEQQHYFRHVTFVDEEL